MLKGKAKGKAKEKGKRKGTSIPRFTLQEEELQTSEQRFSRVRVRPGRGKMRGVPGAAGRDFPTLGSIPMTSFSCIGTAAGFYADLETNCQVSHVRTS